MTPFDYLPGRGGRQTGGLGSCLSGIGTVVGRELARDFAKLSFGEQVDLVRADLSGQDYFIVANSYGCYLLLNALLELPGYAGKILLLSPMLGDAENPETGMVYCPPRAQRFMESLENGRLITGAAMHVLVGSEDWQCNREALGLLKGLDDVDVKEVEGEGHRLSHHLPQQKLFDLLGLN